MMARLHGGGERNIDPGFKVFKDEVGPNVLAYEPSPGKMTELFQSGQALIAVWGSGRVKALADTGFPADFVYPKEGGIALGVAACPIAGAKHASARKPSCKILLDAGDPGRAAKGAGLGPSNKTVELPEERGGRRSATRSSADADWTSSTRSARNGQSAWESRGRALS